MSLEVLTTSESEINYHRSLSGRLNHFGQERVVPAVRNIANKVLGPKVETKKVPSGRNSRLIRRQRYFGRATGYIPEFVYTPGYQRSVKVHAQPPIKDRDINLKRKENFLINLMIGKLKTAFPSPLVEEYSLAYNDPTFEGSLDDLIELYNARLLKDVNKIATIQLQLGEDYYKYSSILKEVLEEFGPNSQKEAIMKVRAELDTKACIQSAVDVLFPDSPRKDPTKFQPIEEKDEAISILTDLYLASTQGGIIHAIAPDQKVHERASKLIKKEVKNLKKENSPEEMETVLLDLYEAVKTGNKNQYDSLKKGLGDEYEKYRSILLRVFEETGIVESPFKTPTLAQLKKDLGEDEYQKYQPILKKLLIDVKRVKDSREEEMPYLSDKDGVLTSLRAATELFSMTEEQRRRVFIAAGYDDDQAAFILRQIGKGALVSNVWGSVTEQGARIAGLTGAFIPFAGAVWEPQAAAILATSYVAWLGTLGINAYKNLEMLKHPKLGYSQSFGATTSYYLSNKLVSEKSQKNATLAGSVGLEIFKELYWIPVWFAPFGPSALSSANFFAAGAEMLLLSSKMWILRKNK